VAAALSNLTPFLLFFRELMRLARGRDGGGNVGSRNGGPSKGHHSAFLPQKKAIHFSEGQNPVMFSLYSA